ncbi:hypothetical protein HQ393_13035 [Chitinibacter bivalviorum]|uniref:Uncharacterized protein n=1 Tax=Chitinibacter bivalviorum TaxID=2739434 RepID=A0A7H9BKR9_9NEIS|nr:hypothetical protein [Chitinibacter bivalviorum]QLG89089.1 hypothetical protein HQ393_13035 [Chitinibacter bivalviorum]
MKLVLFWIFLLGSCSVWAEPVNGQSLEKGQVVEGELDLYGRIIPFPSGTWRVLNVQDGNVNRGKGADEKKDANSRQILFVSQQPNKKTLVFVVNASERYMTGSRWRVDCVPKNAISNQDNDSYDFPECTSVFTSETSDKSELLNAAYKKYGHDGFVQVQVAILPAQYGMTGDWQAKDNQKGKKLIDRWTAWSDSYLLAVKDCLAGKPYFKSGYF